MCAGRPKQSDQNHPRCHYKCECEDNAHRGTQPPRNATPRREDGFVPSLVQDLRWLNRSWYERWYEAIFTSRGRVSWRLRTTMRIIFAFAFIVAAWMILVAQLGATRAHRQRLVWGERLPS